MVKLHGVRQQRRALVQAPNQVPQPERISQPMTENGLAFADGMKYMAARCGHLLMDDPVLIIRILVDVRMAEAGKHPPNRIPVAWKAGPEPWRTEFERLRKIYDQPNAKTPESVRQSGRPHAAEIEWIQKGE